MDTTNTTTQPEVTYPRVERRTDGFQACTTTWRPSDDKPYVIMVSASEPLRDSLGRVRRWGSRQSAAKAVRP